MLEPRCLHGHFYLHTSSKSSTEYNKKPTSETMKVTITVYVYVHIDVVGLTCIVGTGQGNAYGTLS